MRINVSGNVGIATNNPNNILQVGDGARLRISNGVNDYSLIGTKDVDDTTNTRIVISGNTRTSYEGRIEYIATAGDHIFYTSGINERMRIANSGRVLINGILNVNEGNPYAVQNFFMSRGSLTIGGTLNNFGCGSGWNASTAGLMMECQNNTEIAIHDAGNRVVSPMAYYGGGTNRIYIGRDMGWGSTPITIPNTLTIDGTLDFGSVVRDYIINLWGSGNYGFGVNSSTLRYNSDGVHKFYCGGTESSTFTNKGLVIGTYGTQYYPLIVVLSVNSK